MNHSTGKPTQAQALRLARVAAMRCIACEREGCGQPWQTEVHHLVDKGSRKHSGGHDATIPLCAWHHRGQCKERIPARHMAILYGPSLEREKRAFVAKYGTERELLAIIDGRLERVAA